MLNIKASRVFKYIICQLLGCLGPALIPPLHIAALYYFWNQFARHVDKRYCSCSCWDTVFKGTYESGVASYKHIYFNATANTVKIWLLTVVCIVAFYESVRRLTRLCLLRQLRLSMLVLFLSAIFSHYYAWWVYFNYWNDEYYRQWNHQLFFTGTELASTGLVLHLADCRAPITARKALAVTAVAVVHVTAGSRDQFVTNVLHGKGELHQVVRDISFMAPDLLHAVVPLMELRRCRASVPGYLPTSSVTFERSNLCKEATYLATLVGCGLIVFSVL